MTRLLRHRGLARVEPGSLQLHRLLQAILRSQPTQHDMPILVIRLLRAAVPDNPWDNPPTWPTWRALLPHVLAATDTRRIPNPGGDVAWLLDRAGTYLHTRGEPAPARPLLERALGLRRVALGDDHPDTLGSANNLALDLSALGQHDQARQLHEDTLTRLGRVLGDHHPHTIGSAHNLAVILRALGRDAEASELEEWVRSRR